MTARISLIIPSYNQAGFVGEAVQSALAQSHPPAEIVVVDDGSTDEIATQLAHFDGRVKLHRQPNRGPAAARNAGLAMIGSELIAFLDADDLWPRHSLAARLNVLDRTGADLVFGAVANLDMRTRREEPPMPARMAGAMLVRRQAFERVGLFDERLRSAELIDWIDRSSTAGCAMAFADETVLLRRIHGANMMLTVPDTEADRFAVLRRIVGAKRLAQGR
jgi:glycosyltransferase involved in cell wall biosynthesis